MIGRPVREPRTGRPGFGELGMDPLRRAGAATQNVATGGDHVKPRDGRRPNATQLRGNSALKVVSVFLSKQRDGRSRMHGESWQ
jgi:hypothetical protein